MRISNIERKQGQQMKHWLQYKPPHKAFNPAFFVDELKLQYHPWAVLQRPKRISFLKPMSQISGLVAGKACWIYSASNDGGSQPSAVGCRKSYRVEVWEMNSSSTAWLSWSGATSFEIWMTGVRCYLAANARAKILGGDALCIWNGLSQY